MAQIIPPITSLPIDSGAAPSVEDIQDRLPSICVDYLSHNWTEEDVWASWRNMTRHKHEIANGVRLENASWRTWNKQRNKLRTISPETLNWLKDSDVTWLYGPLHTAQVEPVRPLKVSSTDERLGIERGNLKPGILKHRTLTELLSIPGPASPSLEALPDDDEFLDEPVRRPGLTTAKSDTHLARSNSLPARRRGRSPSTAKIAGRSQETSPDGGPHLSSSKRHISFNTFVEQCIALDDPVIHRPSDDSDSDDVLEIRRISSRFSSSSRSSSMTSSSSTIAKIAPGVLKTTGSYANSALPKLVFMPPVEYRSPQSEQSPGITSPFEMPPAVNQSPGVKRWAHGEDEYSNVGFDYFGGPDLTGTSPGVNPTFGRPPAVHTPPTKPKWRQQADSSTPSSSSSSSSLNGLVQQPARGILKVRPAPANPSSPEPVSPPAVFNYNPSVATGIGGMFGGYDGAAQAGLAIGSPVSNDREERGRSTSRGNGSSQYDRSSSRGTSVSSASSLSSVARSPVEPTPKRPNQLDKVQEGTPWAPSQDSDAMDVDASPDRSSTPTPHSSPQIVLRPLKDTSPSSLPHTSSRSPTGFDSELISYDRPYNGPMPTPPLEPTVVHDPVTAIPTLSQPVEDDDDGSTLIGRATNIANTAKDLLGALWYGAHDEAGQIRTQPSSRRS